MARGRFYAIEGADGVGSTTQVNRLVDHLRLAGRTVLMTAEPSKGPIGLMIRQLLGGDRPRTQIHRELALLFAADRLDHMAREVEPALAAGSDVVSDRYIMSSLVYQSLDLPFDWVRDLNRFAPPADSTILISLPADEAWARLDARLQTGATREVFDQKTTQSRIHSEYERQAKRQNAVIVDGRGSPEAVSARVKEALIATNAWPR
jgi:dTMP kinase